MDDIKDQIARVDDKIEKVLERVHSIDKTLVENTIILREHERRSLAAEQNLQLLRQEVEMDMKPVKEHIINIQTIGLVIKWIGVFAATVLSVYGVKKLFF